MIKRSTDVRFHRFWQILGVAAVWVFTHWVGWIGLAGADDFAYVEYAVAPDGPPDIHWEFRWPLILFLRAVVNVFGFSEFVVCIPNLMSSLMFVTAVAIVVDWPRRTSFCSCAAMFIVASIPIDAVFATAPGAATFAGGVGVLGAALFISKGKATYVGALLLAFSFACHEMQVFWVAIVCFSRLALERRKAVVPVAICIAMSLLFILGEAVYLNETAGDAMSRWKTAAGEGGGKSPTFVDRRVSGGTLGFFLWPIRVVIFDKQWSFLLGIAFLGGVSNWRRLSSMHRVVLLSGIGLWLWLGYGTIVPWEYKPRSRAFHYYAPLILVVSVLPPLILDGIPQHRTKLLCGLISLNVLLVSLGGNWGQRVDISRQVLEFAKANPNETILVDDWTYEEMRMCNDLVSRDNVAKWSNRGDKSYDYVLRHLERPERPLSPQYLDYIEANAGRDVYTIPPSYRALFVLVAHWLPERSPFIRSRGAVIYEHK